MNPDDPVAVWIAGHSTKTSRDTARSTARTIERLADGTEWRHWDHAAAVTIRDRAIRSGHAPATVNRIVSGMRSIARTAWRMGLIDSDRSARIGDLPNVRGTRLPRGRALPPQEIERLFAAAGRDRGDKGLRDTALLALLYGCGMRRAEAVTVGTGARSRSDGDTIRVVGKGGRERLIPVAVWVGDCIDAWIERRRSDDGPLLAPIRSGNICRGEALTPSWATLTVRRISRAADIVCSPHDLRRSFVSLELEGGADIALVQRVAGHRSIETTTRYDRRPDRALRAAVEAIPGPASILPLGR